MHTNDCLRFIVGAVDEPGVVGFCYALYDYMAMEPNQISLRRGDRVAIVSKAGSSRGWWKGRNGGKVILLS